MNQKNIIFLPAFWACIYLRPRFFNSRNWIYLVKRKVQKLKSNAVDVFLDLKLFKHIFLSWYFWFISAGMENIVVMRFKDHQQSFKVGL